MSPNVSRWSSLSGVCCWFWVWYDWKPAFWFGNPLNYTLLRSLFMFSLFNFSDDLVLVFRMEAGCFWFLICWGMLWLPLWSAILCWYKGAAPLGPYWGWGRFAASRPVLALAACKFYNTASSNFVYLEFWEGNLTLLLGAAEAFEDRGCLPRAWGLLWFPLAEPDLSLGPWLPLYDP